METHIEIDLLQCAAARISVTVSENGVARGRVARAAAPVARQVIAANPSTVRQPGLFRGRKGDSR